MTIEFAGLINGDGRVFAWTAIDGFTTVFDSRWDEISDRVRTGDQSLSVAERICLTAREVFAARTVSLASVVDHAYRPVAATDDVGTLFDEEQFALGGGPTFDAQQSPVPVIIEDARSRRSQRNWTVFAELAEKHHIFGVYAYPLRLGGAYLGVLTIYCTSAGSPTAERYADGLILASLATAELISMNAGLAPKIVDGDLEPGIYEQSSLQVAAGMVAESLNISIVAALARVRERAFADDQPVSKTAQLIVDRKLVLNQ